MNSRSALSTDSDPSGRSDLSAHLPKLISIVLILLSLLTYWQVQNFDFINMDDPLYITDNPPVRNGLTREGILWAFTFNDISYWHPLTWLSHMADSHIYWLNPKGHHFTNVVVHIASTILLFLTLKGMTGALWRSAFVAAFFALHPLTVESVAWVANRKNLLSGFFWILALWSYAHYAKKPHPGRYLMVFLVMVLGLLAKPTVVTLPFVLLLMDFWPLERVLPIASGQAVQTPKRFTPAGLLIIEKIPLVALSAASITISYLSSRQMGIIIPAEVLPLGLRIQNAVVSYLVYIEKMIWPFDLAIFYPFAKTISLWKTVTTCILLLIITGLAVRVARRKPYFFVGWFWYLGALLPVIGLIQQGVWPAFADRFGYIPLIGLFISAVWGVSDLARRSRIWRGLSFAAGSLAVFGLGIGAWVQTGYWKNSITLFERAVSVTKDNHLAHYNLGVALYNSGRFDDGILHCNEALRINPDDEGTHLAVGSALVHLGRRENAVSHFREALRINPASVTARQQLEAVDKRSEPTQ